MTRITGRDREALRNAMLQCGFTLCGFTDLQIDQQTRDHYNEWLSAGFGAEMHWLHTSVRDRLHPDQRFPWARSAIALALAYDHAPRFSGDLLQRISRYARGRSYHNVMRKRLRRAETALAKYGGTQSKAYCDTGPVLEREFARRAGVGWHGKHSLVLNAEWGSYLFLAVVFTDLEILPDTPTTDHCGTCRACIDACPTSALVAPGVLDSRRCISYLNIEHRGDFAAPYDSPLHDWLHGCDICQEVCPFVQAARRRGRSGDPAFLPDSRWPAVQLSELANLETPAWDRLTRGSDVRRGGLDRIRRIASRLLGADLTRADDG